MTPSFLIDPVLLLLRALGIIYAGIKREISILLWVIPFLALLASLGYVQYFYWIPVIPVFCIAAARLIEGASAIKQSLPYALIAGLTAFGLTCTLLLVTANVTSAQFEATAFVAELADENTTIVSSPVYSWIFIHVFDKAHSFTDYRDLLFIQLKPTK